MKYKLTIIHSDINNIDNTFQQDSKYTILNMYCRSENLHYALECG